MSAELVRVVFMSDTHERWDDAAIPEGDILVHAGDHTMMGEPLPLIQAGERLRRQKHKYKVIIAGNHDWMFETDPYQAQELTGVGKDNLIYLENSAVKIMGLKFWGSPITPWFHDWAFNVDRAELFRYWQRIPSGLDVLITHGPPLGILDVPGEPHKPEHCGDYDLLQAVRAQKPKVHVFGHIHGGYGSHIEGETAFYNASLVSEKYKITNKPFWVDFCPVEKA